MPKYGADETLSALQLIHISPNSNCRGNETCESANENTQQEWGFYLIHAVLNNLFQVMNVYNTLIILTHCIYYFTFRFEKDLLNIKPKIIIFILFQYFIIISISDFRTWINTLNLNSNQIKSECIQIS